MTTGQFTSALDCNRFSDTARVFKNIPPTVQLYRLYPALQETRVALDPHKQPLNEDRGLIRKMSSAISMPGYLD